MRRSMIALAALLLGPAAGAYGRGVQEYVRTSWSEGDFKLVWNGAAADVFVDEAENRAVLNAARLFAEDVERVTGKKSRLRHKTDGLSSHAVIVGTLGTSKVLRELASAGKIDVREVEGKWETFLIAVVPRPLPGVETGLVIAGSDRRGAIYGLFDVSENMGVSPWYWFADVHPQKQDALSIRRGTYREGPPSVKYRGIFINDEMWGILPWAMHTHAPDEGKGLGPKTHRRIFELLLRLKANHLWPAMHRGTIPFNYYKDNKRVADEYAIVMGSSHIEPMLRNNIAGAEWDREYPGEPWNYLTNRDHIYKYWEDRIKANGKYENVYTLGKRGKDDEAGKDVTVPVLEKIFADQRAILSKWVDPNPEKVPQVLIAYTEVLGLYNRGLKVPDDVILCWPDDNFGNIRQLPDARERRRPGGSGIYYHFQWLQGASACYVWLHTTPLGLTWQQMHMAHAYNARKLWVVNVGDIKPAEVGIEYFMRLAWDIRPWTHRNTRAFLKEWATRDFGAPYADAIADIYEKHFELGYARRPENMVMYREKKMQWEWFSLDHYNDEAQRRIDAYDRLIKQVDDLYARLPRELKDAFFQMVLYNVKGAALHNKKALYAQKCIAYGKQGRASAASYGRRAKEALQELERVIDHYNTGLLTVGAKWNRMASMPGPYGGQRYQFVMPPLSDFSGSGPAALHVAPEGGKPGALPDFSVYMKNRRFVDLYNAGTGPVKWSAEVSDDWIVLSEASGEFTTERRIWVSVDWKKVPAGTRRGSTVTFRGAGTSHELALPLFNPPSPAPDKVRGFVESHGYVSMEAEHYSRKVERSGAGWERVSGLGRTGDSMTVLPPTIPPVTGSNIPSASPVLEYDVHLFSAGPVTVILHASPTLPIHKGYGRRFAVSFDDGTPVEVENVTRGVIDNVRKIRQKLEVDKPGPHVLKVWMVDPGMVLDKIVIDTGGLKESYLGPPESYRRASSRP